MSTPARKYAELRRIFAERGPTGVARAVEKYAYQIPYYGRVRDHVRVATLGPRAIATRRRYGDPNLLVGYWGGIGDDLLLTVVLRELRLRAYPGVWMVTQHPELFRYTDDVDVVLPWSWMYEGWIKEFGWTFVRPFYSRYLPQFDRDVRPPAHIVTLMCEKVGIVGPITRRPYLTLTDAEREGGRRVPNQIAIQSAGLNARFAMKTKQWYPERFQQVVDALKHEFHFVQLGSKADPPLDGTLDLRGATSLRETAGVLSQSVAFVGQVSLLMHLARAVDCRSVIVYGGREHPSQTGYSCNENLYTPVRCSPCWKLNTCGHGMVCMRDITAQDVVAAVRVQASRYGQPLAVDTDVIPADGVPTRTTPDGRTWLTITDVFGARKELEAKVLPHTPNGLDLEPRRYALIAA